MIRLGALLLTAALLFRPLAALAQSPAPANAANINAITPKWHTVILRHSTPSSVMEQMNWKMTMFDPFAKSQHLPLSPAEANFPEGVTQIFPLTSNNSLLLSATEAGYKTCLEIISVLDAAPRQVTMKLLLVAVPSSSKQKIDLSHPNQAVLQLRKTNAFFCEPSQTTGNTYTTDIFDNNVTTTTPFVLPFHGGLFSPDSPPMNGSYLAAASSLCITPHINSDSSITFNLDLAGLISNPDSTVPSQPMTIVHTVSNGEVAAYDVTHFFQTKSYRKLLFVTLTALSPAAGDASVAVAP